MNFVIVNVFNQQNDLEISSKKISSLVKHVIKEEGQTCDEVNIYLVDTPTICDLHQKFFDDPTPTDCISFPIDTEEDELCYRLLGEVFVCPATAKEYALLHSGNPLEETSLYIVHGLLHLMGYDDISDNDCIIMRAAEQRHMQSLKKSKKLLGE